MAVSPNDDFVAGDVLTALEMNKLPRGLMADVVTSSTTDTSVTAEEVELTVTFTAVANRNYRIVYIEPQLSGTSTTTATVRLRSGSLTGTVIASTIVGIPNTLLAFSGFVESIGTFTAGSQTVVGTLQFSAGTGTATRSALRLAMLYVEDLGAA
jgi:hypothetical protein